MTPTGAFIGSVGMSNVLSEEKKQQVIALGKLGWPLRRIEKATGVRRETISAYLKAAGVVVCLPGWGHRAPAKPDMPVTTDPPKPAIGVTTDSGASHNQGPPTHPEESASLCEPYREWIAREPTPGNPSLEKAVREEKYEDAAQIRDQIRELEAKWKKAADTTRSAG